MVALVHKVKGTFRRNDLFVKYMDRIVSTAESHAAETQPAQVELGDDVDLDFFDRQDLGVLNRRLRKVQPCSVMSACTHHCNSLVKHLCDRTGKGSRKKCALL